MPDKWEYPWYAAWDLAFHMLPLALIDPEWAKRQLILLTREWYMHPNGQIAGLRVGVRRCQSARARLGSLRVYQIERKHHGHADTAFLERVFHKLLLNFTWWVNRKDDDGNNVFQGGFWGWTISASLTAANHCPPAGIWIRPMAPPGWRCIA